MDPVLVALEAVSNAYRDAESLTEYLNRERLALMHRARDSGYTLGDIADIAGVSRQRIHQLLAAPDSPSDGP